MYVDKKLHVILVNQLQYLHSECYDIRRWIGLEFCISKSFRACHMDEYVWTLCVRHIVDDHRNTDSKIDTHV